MQPCGLREATLTFRSVCIQGVRSQGRITGIDDRSGGETEDSRSRQRETSARSSTDVRILFLCFMDVPEFLYGNSVLITWV